MSCHWVSSQVNKLAHSPATIALFNASPTIYNEPPTSVFSLLCDDST